MSLMTLEELNETFSERSIYFESNITRMKRAVAHLRLKMNMYIQNISNIINSINNRICHNFIKHIFDRISSSSMERDNQRIYNLRLDTYINLSSVAAFDCVCFKFEIVCSISGRIETFDCPYNSGPSAAGFLIKTILPRDSSSVEYEYVDLNRQLSSSNCFLT